MATFGNPGLRRDEVMRNLDVTESTIMPTITLPLSELRPQGAVAINNPTKTMYYSDGLHWLPFGAQGAQGFQGFQGSQGVAGTQGVGSQGFQGSQGVSGAGGNLNDSAYASNTASTVVAAGGFFTFNIIGPQTGTSVTPPAPAGTSFTIVNTGTYEFNYQVRGSPGGALSPPFPIIARLWNATAAAPVPGSQYASDSQTTALAAAPNGTEAVNGFGTASLTAGAVIELQNWTTTGGNSVTLTSVPLGGDATINASLRLVRIA
jgi:hypothetical protein